MDHGEGRATAGGAGAARRLSAATSLQRTGPVTHLSRSAAYASAMGERGTAHAVADAARHGKSTSER
ncbi:hypothetical protein [Chondromyces crocatus]|uniref:hypothetical protein n=1 Tax=Chondromyces crocatus TaxID=52 RepID=UPI0012E0FC3C|nr:hypothetical protein [Chondromyces crocatus]